MKYFTSDQHFGHSGVLRLGKGRPFSSIEEMENFFVANHNRVIRPKDQVYHLGDFAYKTSKIEAQRILKRLNGIHFLCLGNHDWTAREMIQEIGFKDVFENRWIILQGNNTSHKVMLSHYPYYPSLTYRIKCKLKGWHFDERYLHKRIVDSQGNWLLHGHTHSDKQISHHLKSINVGVDANNWTPVSEKQILKIINKT